MKTKYKYGLFIGFVVITIVSVLLNACSEKKGGATYLITPQNLTQTVTEATIQGNWILNCTKVKDKKLELNNTIAKTQKIQFTGDSMHLEEIQYSDHSCIHKQATGRITATYKLGNFVPNTTSGFREIDITPITLSVIDNKTGHTSNVPGVARQLIFSIIKIENNLLYLGESTSNQDGSSPQTRHSSIQPYTRF